MEVCRKNFDRPSDCDVSFQALKISHLALVDKNCTRRLNHINGTSMLCFPWKITGLKGTYNRKVPLLVKDKSRDIKKDNKHEANGPHRLPEEDFNMFSIAFYKLAIIY